MCRKLPGIAIGRLCEKCAALTASLCRPGAHSQPHAPAGDGKCVICDSYVRPATLVRVCDECNYGSYAGRCVICGGVGISDAYYCKECTLQEKDVRATARAGRGTDLTLLYSLCSRWRTGNSLRARAHARRETAVPRL